MEWFPGGRTMIRPYRVHEEQISHLKEYLKVFCSQRSGTKGRRVPGHPLMSHAKESTKPVSTGDEKPELSSVADTEAVLLAGEGPGTSVIRCDKCGERFPLMDFYYTQKTGLCIPCWEKNII